MATYSAQDVNVHAMRPRLPANMSKLPCQAAKARRCNSHLDWTSQTLSSWTDESTAAAIMSDPMDVHFNAETEKNPSLW
jgi:hypothetical protein